MKRVDLTPNFPTCLGLIVASIWLGAKYLDLLHDLSFIPDLVRVLIWAIAFMCTPFFLWWLLELLLSLLYFSIPSFMRLFFTAFIQIFLVAANTVFISRGFIIGMLLSSFGINWLWTHNVRKTVFGGESDRLWYASGATLGCLSGYYFSQILC